SARLLNTSSILASSFFASMASMIACRLVPPPEINTAMETGFAIIFSSANRHAARAVADLAHHKGPLAHALEQRERAVGALWSDHENHAQAVVEGPVHFVLRHGAEFLNQRKHRRHRPAAARDERCASLRQHPRQIAGDAAAGDVRGALHAAGGE